MDVTALLNTTTGAGEARRGSASSSTPSATGETTATTTAVPTPEPEPEQMSPRRGSGSPSPSRKPWTAQGFSLPLALDTKSIPSFRTHLQLCNTINIDKTVHNN